jgi:hypothetical protein
MRPPITPAKNKGQIGTLFDEGRTQEIVHGKDRDRPDEEEGGPAGVVTPIHPDDAWQQDGVRAELRNRKHEHRGGEQSGWGYTGDCESDAAQGGLNEGRHDDAVRIDQGN